MTPAKPAAELSRLRSPAWFLGAAGLYGALVLLSLGLTGQRSLMATLWFANGVGVVALLAVPMRQWLALLAALAGAQVLAYALVAGATLGWAQGWGTALAVGADLPGHGVEMLLAALLLKRLPLQAAVLSHHDVLARVLLLGVLVPSAVGSVLGAWLVSALQDRAFAPVWAVWLVASLVGSMSVLPLALAFWFRGWAPLRQALSQPEPLGLLLICLSVTLMAATTLPNPFVVMVLPLMLLAARTDFSVTALATALTAFLLGGLMDVGVLVVPPSSSWWGDGLFYISLLATLLPALFLVTSVEGRAAVLAELKTSEQRYRTLYTQTPVMLHSIDPQGRIITVSQRWLSTLGYAEHEVLGRPVTEFLTPESARLAQDKEMTRATRAGRSDDVPYQMVTREGQVLEVLLSAIWEFDAAGRPVRSLAVLQDVTEKKRLAERSHYAEHDPLTGLPNRVLLQDRLERSCSHHARHGGAFALGFLDLDHFKAINDTLGHEAGDALLCEVASRLRGVLRASDTVCRLGGDEFVLLFAGVDDPLELQALADKILAQLAQPCRLGEGADAPVVTVAGSLGLAVFPEHGRDPATLMQHADQAMYRAKREGRNRCEFYKEV
jgi:diguanylate cyclase (GGDEF)-like protein/PAS domain S-box-containing protein